MHRKFTLLTCLVVVMIIVSCKKSNSPQNPNGLVGNWNFLYIKANTTASITVSGITNVTVANYTSQNNAGTATFTADSLALKGLAYSVNTTATAYQYMGSTLIGSSTVPFTASVPSTNETVAYKVIGSDSLNFPGGGPVPGAGSGGRFTIKGDTLNIAVNGSTIGPGGVNEVVTGNIYFLKQ
ncbi:MAG TPA: hypothetical protein VHE54_16760 [Puia sp.]|nr:hypothetical protein [Puia sp.]